MVHKGSSVFNFAIPFPPDKTNSECGTFLFIVVATGYPDVRLEQNKSIIGTSQYKLSKTGTKINSQNILNTKICYDIR